MLRFLRTFIEKAEPPIKIPQLMKNSFCDEDLHNPTILYTHAFRTICGSWHNPTNTDISPGIDDDVKQEYIDRWHEDVDAALTCVGAMANAMENSDSPLTSSPQTPHQNGVATKTKKQYKKVSYLLYVPVDLWRNWTYCQDSW